MLLLYNKPLVFITLSLDIFYRKFPFFSFTGEYLSNRSWQGLDQQLGETPVVKAVEGQFGIAAGYTENPSNKDMK